MRPNTIIASKGDSHADRPHTHHHRRRSLLLAHAPASAALAVVGRRRRRGARRPRTRGRADARVLRQLQDHRGGLRRRASRRARRGQGARLVAASRRRERRPRHGDHGRTDDRAAPRHPHRGRLQTAGLRPRTRKRLLPFVPAKAGTQGRHGSRLWIPACAGMNGTEYVPPSKVHPMLQWLAQFPPAPIVNGFLDTYRAKLAAANAQGAQAVEVARAALLAEIEARKSANAVILAEQGRWYTAIVRPLLAAPVVIYLWKVIVWDIVLGLGTTDPIGGHVPHWAACIVPPYLPRPPLPH